MRRLLPFVLALALVPAAAAATARERPVAGPISTVSITGTEIAYVGRVQEALPRDPALGRRLPGRQAACKPLLRQHEHGQRRRRRDRLRRPRALADLHRRKHPRMVALDEGAQREGPAHRLQSGRRRWPGADHPRASLGRLAPVRDREQDRRSRTGRLAPLHTDRTGPRRLAERPLAGLCGGARERQCADDLARRQAAAGARVRAGARPGGVARRSWASS